MMIAFLHNMAKPILLIVFLVLLIVVMRVMFMFSEGGESSEAFRETLSEEEKIEYDEMILLTEEAKAARELRKNRSLVRRFANRVKSEDDYEDDYEDD